MESRPNAWRDCSQLQATADAVTRAYTASEAAKAGSLRAGHREPTWCRNHAQAARQLQAEELEIAALRGSTETELRAVADALQRVSQQHQQHVGSQAMGSSQTASRSRPAGRCLSGNATLLGSCTQATWAGPSVLATAGSSIIACVRCSI